MACPECGFDHPSLGKYAGKTLKCPKCGVAFKVVVEAPLELSEPPPPPPAPAANVPSPASPMEPKIYATTARRAAGFGGAKVATGGFGGLIALVLIAVRIYSGCDSAGSKECLRFNDQVVAALRPVDDGFKSLEITLGHDSGPGESGQVQATLKALQDSIAAGRSRLGGLNPPSRKGATEFLTASRDYVEAAGKVVAAIVTGKFDSAALAALKESRGRIRTTQKTFMDANGLVEAP